VSSAAEVILIGAGQSGLAATRALQAYSIRPVVLEAGPGPVGSWPHY
jgi:putative flavoprotein involved in K+ transport